MKTIILPLLFFLSFCTASYSKTTTSIANTNWNLATTWDNGVPTNGDIVIVNNDVILNVNIGYNNLTLTVNNGASIVGTKYIEIWTSGTITNNGTISCSYYDGTADIENSGTWTCSASFTAYSSPTITNFTTGTINAGTYLAFWGSTEVYNQGVMNAPNATTSNPFQIDGNFFENKGEITAQNVSVYDNSLDNYGSISITNNLDHGNNVFNNYAGGNLTVGNIYSIWGSIEIYNYGSITITGNTTFSLDNIIENHGYFEVYNLDGGVDLLNEGTFVVRNNVNSLYSTTNATFTNGSEAELIIGGDLIFYNSHHFINNGYVKIGDDATIGGGSFTNNGLIIGFSRFVSSRAVTNDGAIYCIGDGNYINDWTTSSLSSTSCGHINVGCNSFVNRTTVTGNINIYGNRLGAGTYAPTVTYNPYCPCDIDITYYSRDDGFWDEYDLCGGGKSVWSIEQVRPNPVYEYPKYYGNVIVNGHTIEVDATCNQPLSCDSLTLKPLGFLTIDVTKALNVNEDFIIESPENTGATGSLIDYGTLNVTGNETVQRYITETNWHYLGFPVDQVSGSMFNQNNFYSYLESNNDSWSADNINGTSGWVNAGTGNLTTEMQGYIYYYYDDMLEFSGNLNTGTQSIALSYTNNNPAQPQFDGWNLLCNPYPSSIDWENVTTTGIIDNCVYFYEDDGSSPYYNNYKYYIKGGGGSSPYPSVAVNGASQYIPVAQAFFVRTTTNGQNFSFDNTVRTHSSQDFYKSEKRIHPNLLRLQVSNGKHIDETVVRFIPSAGRNFDSGFDAIKMYTYSGDLPNLYSITENLQNLAINTLPDHENRIVRLGFKTNVSGNFNISANELNFENTDDIYLFDGKTNTYQNLKEEPSYHFYSENGNFTNRFKILFGKPTNFDDASHQVMVYAFEKQINIIQQTQEAKQLNINIYRIDGRLVRSLNTVNRISNLSVDGGGIYIVTVINDDNKTVKKVIVE